MATVLDTLITDRTAEDVERAYYLESLWEYDKSRGKLVWGGTTDEYNEWLNDPKGEYRYTTLNRVEESVEYVADLLDEIGYHVTEINIKLDWKYSDIPILSQANRFLSNLRKIRSAIPLKNSIPSVPPDLDKLTVEEANDIETILFDVGKEAEKISSRFRHCNAATCGLEDLIR